MLSFNLHGKTALVGGSTQGIGLATAQLLSAMGARCVLISRNEEKLKAALATLTVNEEQPHTYLIADYQHPQQVNDVVASFLENNTIDVLINNSGGPAGGPVVNATPAQFLAAFQQHLICNHMLTQLVIAHMRSAGWGRIINIISTSVKIPLKDLGVSNTIRGAVASWAKTMANELGQFGITVNNVLPGATATERLATIIDNKATKTGHSKEEVEKEMLSEVPARRFAQPEEIAAMIAFLASPSASYVNGTSIPVDGGRTGSI